MRSLIFVPKFHLISLIDIAEIGKIELDSHKGNLRVYPINPAGKKPLLILLLRNTGLGLDEGGGEEAATSEHEKQSVFIPLLCLKIGLEKKAAEKGPSAVMSFPSMTLAVDVIHHLHHLGLIVGQGPQ